jgi:hypothetical protein
MSPSPSKALVVLVADIDTENAIRGVLGRWQSLGIQKLTENIDYDIHRHSQRDPGCRLEADKFLRNFVRTHRHGLVIFDFHGCGAEHENADSAIESRVEQLLSQSGWGDRCACIVINPEIEAWVWSNSPHVDTELGWRNRHPSLKQWMELQSLLPVGGMKPADPKTALRKALREVGKPQSSGIYLHLAENVGLSRCQDRAFSKLKTVLINWFLANPN